MQPGDVVSARTAGGGGYGPAWQRGIDQVREDVRLGYVSAAAARDDYGVVITEDGCVNVTETAQLRQRLSDEETKR